MAVLLCREGKPLLIPVPLELRGLPRISLDYEPVPGHSSYLGKPVLTRTNSRFAYKEQPREKTQKEQHDRHRFQLTQCGFHAPSSKVYKELGSVELDDTKLILETLGQAKKDQANVEILQQPRLHLAKFEEQPPFMVSPYQVKIHSKMSSQFPSELLHLDDKVKKGEHQLSQMKRGRSLFKLMEEDRRKKESKEKAQLWKDHSEALYQWKEAEVMVDLSGMENGFPPSPEPPEQQESTTRRRSALAPRAMGDREASARKRRVSLAPQAMRDLASVRKKGSLAPQAMEDLSASVRKRRSSVAPQAMEACILRKKQSLSTIGEGNVEPTAIEITCTDEEGGEVGVAMEDSLAGRVIEKWYRKLCVMVWILKAMQLDSPHHSIPISKCWDITPQYTDDTTGKKRYDYSKKRLSQWEELKNKRIVKTKSFRAKVATLMAFRSLTPVRVPAKKAGNSEVPREGSLESQVAGSQISQVEEEELRRQERFRRNVEERWTAHVPALTLDLAKMKTKFFESDEKRRMVVHEQLAAMERDRVEALQQRLGALKVTVNMWKDLAAMREGLEIETTAMARKKLLMNYKWFEELVGSLPEDVMDDYYCQQILERLGEIAQHMYSVGPGKMSRRRLIQVLATLNPWELQSPDIGGAVKHLIQHVIYVAEEDYTEWLKQHTAVYRYHHPPTSKDHDPSTAALSPGDRTTPTPTPSPSPTKGKISAEGSPVRANAAKDGPATGGNTGHRNSSNTASNIGRRTSNAGGTDGNAGGKGGRKNSNAGDKDRNSGGRNRN